MRIYEVLTPYCNYLVHNVGGGDAGDPGGVCCPREAGEGVVWCPVCLHFCPPPPSPCRAPDPPHRTKRNYEGVSYTGCQTVAGYNAWCYIDAGTCTAGATSHSPGWDYCTDTLSQWCPDGWTYNSFSTYGDGG